MYLDASKLDILNLKKALPKDELEGGEWRTIHGSHVYIKDGKIVAGAKPWMKGAKAHGKGQGSQDRGAHGQSASGSPSGVNAGGQKPGRSGKNPVGVGFLAEHGVSSIRKYKAPSFTFHEVQANSKGAKAFYQAIKESKEGNDHGAFVNLYPEKDYRHMRLFLSEDGEAGFALKHGDIVSVFKNPKKDSTTKGVAGHMLEMALMNGGKTLDCFDGYLPKLYSKFGFEPKARMKFDRQYAPEGWNYERDGEPDVCFFQHNGASLDEIKKAKYPAPDMSKTPVTDDYDEAVKWQHAGLAKSFTTEDDFKAQYYRHRDGLEKSIHSMRTFMEGWTLNEE